MTGTLVYYGTGLFKDAKKFYSKGSLVDYNIRRPNATSESEKHAKHLAKGATALTIKTFSTTIKNSA
jgi:hypothetical protein